MSEQVIYHAKDRMEAGMIVELLQNEGIPAYFKGTEGGDFMTLYTGRSLYGEDVNRQRLPVQYWRNVICWKENSIQWLQNYSGELKNWKKNMVFGKLPVTMTVRWVHRYIWS